MDDLGVGGGCFVCFHEHSSVLAVHSYSRLAAEIWQCI